MNGRFMRTCFAGALALALASSCSLLTSTDGLSSARAPDGAAGAPDDASGSPADGTTLESGQGEGGEGVDGSGDGGASDAPLADALGCTRDEDCVDGKCLDNVCERNPVLVGGAGSGIFGFAIVNDVLYWAQNTQVLARPLKGGTLRQVDPEGAGGHMAWTDQYLYFPLNTDIRRLPLQVDGGTTEVLFTGPESPITALAIVGSDLYYTRPSSLCSIPIGGGAEQVRVTGFGFAEGLFAAGTTLYVADRIAGKIFKVEAGQTVATPLAINVPDVRDMFVDGTTMWLTEWASRTVFSTPADGTGKLQPIAVGQAYVSQIIVTSTSVYWAAGTNIWTVPR